VNANRWFRSWPRRRLVIWGAAILLTTGVAVFGRSALAWWTRQMAARNLTVGTLSTAQRWLAWSDWFDPSDGRTDLMRATGLRRRYQQAAWKEAVESAERKGAPAERVRQERRLGLIQAGAINNERDELTSLVEAGVATDDACTAFVHGYLARRDAPRAEMVLDAWAVEVPGSAHVAYMRGVYWLWLGDGAGDLGRRYECRDRAEKEFKDSLAVEPRHEMARQTLADLLEEDDRLEEALVEFAALAADFPANDSAKLGVARLLRGLGALGQARQALSWLPPERKSSADTAAEVGQIELESGHYQQAQNWLTRVDLSWTADADALRAAATAFAVEGKTTVAERLFARLDREHGNWARTEELQLRLATGRGDPKAADELRRLSATNAGWPTAEPLGRDRPPTSPADLYAQHCSGCHGSHGDGNGRGARHLFPRARNFRTERFRLASSVNAVATLDDVVAVIRRGMPGTSMRAYEELSDQQRVLLAQEVLRLRREGRRERLIRSVEDEGDEIDEDEIHHMVDSWTVPGPAVSVPAIGPNDSQAVARGKDQYFALGCQNCHGDDGTGSPDLPCYDERGISSKPRDLVHDPFKGGPEAESLYLRIFVGMPGTAHPSCSSVSVDRLVDLVHYCRWLSRAPRRVQTNHQRAVEDSRRPPAWLFDG